MRIALSIAWAVVYATLTAGAANACIVRVAVDLNDAALADAVVIGEITGYRIIEDQAARTARREMLERSPELQEIIGDDAGYLSDYARFNIVISTVLRGEVLGVVDVAWNNSTFGEPQ